MEKALQIQKQVESILGEGNAFLVGGSVRDVVLEKTPKDYDFSTPLLPNEVRGLVEKAGRKVYDIGERFGTIGFKVEVINTYEPTLRWHSKYEYVEVTTYRSEVYTSKSRKPEVSFIPSLDEDLARRDFTINAMILESDGNIYDPFGGRLDILAKQIKTVGLPKDRIKEDPLRMLRAARFASQLGFGVDPNMIGKMKQLGYTITYVSKERWVQELDKLLVGKHPMKGIKVLMESDVMKYILPEVYLALEDDFAYQALNDSFTKDDTANINERWAMLLAYVGHPYTFKDNKGKVTFVNHETVRNELLQGICARLKFSNERSNALLKDKKIFNKSIVL